MKKKKSKKFLFIRGSILLIVGLVSLIFVIYFNFIKKDDNPFKDSKKYSDAVKFKEEYESLNNITDEKGNKKYIQVKIPKDNPIVYKTGKEIVDIIENKTGIIYFGYSKSMWSRNIIEALLDVAKTNKIKEVYYLDISNIRQELILDDSGKVITKKEGTTDYIKMLELLNDYLKPYDGLNDESIKRINDPTVLFVKDGKVIELKEGTVDSHTNALEKLTKKQYNELKQIYVDAINKMNNQDNVCKDDSSC